jgi:Flp pilus assembly protein TadB
MSAFILSLLSGGATFTALLLVVGQRRYLNDNVQRLRRMLGLETGIREAVTAATQAQTYDADYRAHLLLRRFNIAHTLENARAVQRRLQLLLALGAGLLGVLFDLPLLMTGAVGLLVYWIPQQVAQNTWRRARSAAEEELIALVTDLRSLTQFTANPLEALEEAEANLRVADSEILADELQQTLLDVRRHGDRGWRIAEERAHALSSTLAMLYFSLGRLKQTGGTRFAETFDRTGDTLIDILGIRMRINSQAQSGKSTMNVIAIVLALILASMLSDPVMRAAYTTPLGQLILAGSVLLMGLGYWYIHRMIEKVML